MDNFEPKIKLEHADVRGEIYSISLPGDQELMLLHSTPGSLRGGHAHDVSEIIVLLTGSMTYHKRLDGDEERTEILHAGDCSFNQAMEYHVAEFSEDSVLLEWKINTKKGAWKNIDYKPYRDKVLANATG